MEHNVLIIENFCHHMEMFDVGKSFYLTLHVDLDILNDIKLINSTITISKIGTVILQFVS